MGREGMVSRKSEVLWTRSLAAVGTVNALSESLRRDCTSPLAGDASSCSSICIYTAFTAIRDVPKQHLYSRLRGRILSVSASVDPFSHSHPLPPAPHVTASHCTTMPLISNQHSLCCKYRTALPFIVLPGQPISVQKPTWIVRMVLECCGTVVVTA